jgi:hypothetical protein
MPKLTLSYYIIKYVANHGGGEEYPIGVIANHDQAAYFRALGVKNRTEVDHTPLCYLTGLNAEDAWAYHEWVDWFYDVIENEGTAPDGLDKLMSRLQATGTSITVDTGEPIALSEGQDLVSMVDRLYEKHVNN